MPLHTLLSPGMGQNVKTFFSEFGHVAYQIKGNEVNNNMQVNSLPIHTLFPWDAGQKVKTFFPNMVLLHINHAYTMVIYIMGGLGGRFS